MESKQTVHLHNRFDIEVIDARTGKLKQKAFAENIILDALWTQLIANCAAYFNYIAIGGGTGTLAASRESLFEHIDAKEAGTPTYTVNAAGGWVSARCSITLLETEYNGSTLTEVGISYGGSEYTLATHSMIKDMNGNTTSIAKTETDIINIYATVYARISGGEWMSGALKMVYDQERVDANSTTNFTAGMIRAILGFEGFIFTYMLFSDWKNFRAYYRTLGSGYFGADANFVPAMVEVDETRTLETKTLSYYGRCPAASANSSRGIHAVWLTNNSYYSQYDIHQGSIVRLLFPNSNYESSDITGENIGTGDGTAINFGTNFPLVKSGAIVKVNGTAVSATVDTLIPNQADICHLMKEISFYPFFIYAYYLNNFKMAIPFIGTEYAYADGWYATEAAPCIFENPYYQTVAIETLKLGSYGRLYASDDLETWDLVLTSANSETVQSISATYQNKRYWKVLGRESDGLLESNLRAITTSDYTATNVHLTAAPANGDVVTIDYETEVVAKDANHVLDVTFTFTFAEWTN